MGRSGSRSAILADSPPVSVRLRRSQKFTGRARRETFHLETRSALSTQTICEHRMSFGALSPNAVRALSRGAKMAWCYMSTGEGSLSPYHVEGDCDILYQIGPAKFGCRTPDGQFPMRRRPRSWHCRRSRWWQSNSGRVRKPSKGGLLPKEKITKEIAASRGIPMGKDCHSPNRFEEFDDAPSLLDFIERVRKLTGKPIGLKMVVGSITEVNELCREIRKRGDGPDFIAVDGNEGGSGAAPLALVDHVGLPLVDALIAVDGAPSAARDCASTSR